VALTPTFKSPNVCPNVAERLQWNLINRVLYIATVFSTAFELRWGSTIFFMRRKKKFLKKKGEIFLGVKNVLLLKFDGF
jgi:hypothetical protein